MLSDKERKIRTGIIGLGKMGILHSALINMIPKAELVCLHDSNRRLSKYVKKSGLNVIFYSNLDQMLENAGLEAVFVCTPPYTHFSLAQRCLAHNLDLFVEKPLAESLESAKKMFSLVEDKETIHSTGYNIAHFPIFRKAKAILDENVLERLFRFNFSIYISQVFSKKKGWFFDKGKSGGGVVIDIASHLIYLLIWYFGIPQKIYAKTLNFFSSVEDAATVMMEYENGMCGLLDADWSVPGYRLSTIEIILEGKNGIMEITNNHIKLNLYRATPNFSRGWTILHRIDLSSSSQFDLGSEGFYEEDSHFVECCLDRNRPHVTWLEGLEVQRVIEAIYRSAELNQPVNLDNIK